jgi:hypothetical protein
MLYSIHKSRCDPIYPLMSYEPSAMNSIAHFLKMCLSTS